MAEHPLHYRAAELSEGTGVRLRRLFPAAGLAHLDPFVLFDEFFVATDGGFPDHPHRGFEVLTYLFSGALRHHDSQGGDAVAGSGGALVFTAGRGIVHSEMPDGKTECHGIELWINLPHIQKEAVPAFHHYAAEQLPLTTLPYGSIRTVAGAGSPLHLHTPLLCHDVSLQGEGEYHVAIPPGYTGFIYGIDGLAHVLDETLESGTALVLAGGSTISVSARRPCRFMCISGRPHGEPMLQHGAFVD